MKTAAQLRDDRAKLVTEMRKMLDGAEDGKLTSDQHEKYERMDKEVDALTASIVRMDKQEERERSLDTLQRQPLHGKSGEDGEPASATDEEYREAFFAFVRGGESGISAKQRQVLTSRADLTVGTDSKGGYLVPTLIANRIIEGLNAENYIRRMANVYSTASTTNIPVDESVPSFAFMSEGGTYAQTDVTLSQVVIGAHKMGGVIKVSEELLEDSMFDLEAHLSRKIIVGVGAAEEDAFLTGDGSGKPTGIVTSAGAGVTAASTSAVTSDEVLDFVYSMLPRYRSGASMLAATSFVKACHKLKDSNGQYIWQPSLQEGKPDMIAGRPVYESENMTSIAAGSVPAVLVNLGYYDVVDRGGMYIQRLLELYAGTGMVGYRVRKRTEGKLTIASAAKKFTMAAS